WSNRHVSLDPRRACGALEADACKLGHDAKPRRLRIELHSKWRRSTVAKPDTSLARLASLCIRYARGGGRRAAAMAWRVAPPSQGNHDLHRIEQRLRQALELRAQVDAARAMPRRAPSDTSDREHRLRLVEHDHV